MMMIDDYDLAVKRHSRHKKAPYVLQLIRHKLFLLLEHKENQTPTKQKITILQCFLVTSHAY